MWIDPKSNEKSTELCVVLDIKGEVHKLQL